MLTLEQLQALKPSQILQAMVDGMLEHAKDDRFKFDMDSFGYVAINGDEMSYFGCASNCCLSKLSGVLYPDLVTDEGLNNAIYWLDTTVDDIKRIGEERHIHLSVSDIIGNTFEDRNSQLFMENVELSLDFARSGSVFAFLDCMNRRVSPLITSSWYTLPQWDGRFYFTTNNWEAELPKLQQVIHEMAEVGL